MKQKLIHLLIIVGILAAVFGGLPAVLAQENEPPLPQKDDISDFTYPKASQPDAEPDPPEYDTPLESGLAPGITLEPIGGDKQPESTLSSLLSRATPLTNVINIATQTGVAETHSAIAHGGNRYVVAYEVDRVILAAVLSENGTYEGVIIVSPTEKKSLNPAIAYDSVNDLFIIAYQWDYYNNGTDYDIYIQAVSARFRTKIGGLFSVAYSSSHEQNPDIACNPQDSSCLVVYGFDNKAGSKKILGSYFAITGSGVERIGAEFDISLDNNSSNPHVAWGPFAYMVVYTYPATGVGEKFPIQSKVHPKYQTSGSQVIYSNIYVINPGDLPAGRDKIPTSVAFDFGAKKFLVTYTYDYWGNGSDFDVYCQVMAGDINAYGFGRIVIAGTNSHETSADIMYIKDAHLSLDNTSPGNLAVVYTRYDSTIFTDGIMATILKGNKHQTAPVYNFDGESAHLVIKEPFPTIGSMVFDPTVAGSSNGAQAFVSFTNLMTGFAGAEENILGRIFGLQAFNNFLPLIFK